MDAEMAGKPLYVVQLDDSGKPFNTGSDPNEIGNLRITAPSTLVLLAPFVNHVRSPKLHLRNGRGQTNLTQTTIIDKEGAAQFTIELKNDFGPLAFWIECQEVESHTTDEVVLVVTPEQSTQDLNMITIMPRNLGPLSEWSEKLTMSSYANYNSIHFTPIQKLGISGSCFSMYDPLMVNPDVVGTNVSIDQGWSLLGQTIAQLETELNMISTQDIVLNHLSKDSPFVINNPTVGYNTENCPWLVAAQELDSKIQQFSNNIVDGKYRSSGVTEHIKDNGDIDRIVQCFQHEVLTPFRMAEWLTANNEAYQLSMANYNQAKASSSHDLGTMTIEEALRRSIGMQRHSVHISFEDAKKLGSDILNDVHQFKKAMGEALATIASDSGSLENDIIQSLKGIVAWERLDQKRGPIRKDCGFTLLPNYFTTVKNPKEDNKEYHLAHNGWVMGWDATKDFAQAGSTVYLGRRLCVWSDCFKLNYGDSPADNPLLWDTMKSYMVRTAKIFKGIRLDNCHSTPLAVAEYLLQAARLERPDILVYAELFTNDRATDVKFEGRLGLNALIREVQHSRDPKALACLHTHYGATPIGNLPTPPADLFIPSNISQIHPGRPILTPRRMMAPPLLFDQTHDNPAMMELFPGAHSLAAAAVTAIGPFGLGSTYGVDLLVPHHMSVVEETRSIAVLKPPTIDSDEEEQSWLITLSGHGDAMEVTVAGTWNNWTGQEAILRDGHWELKLDKTAVSDRAEFRFIVDGEWMSSYNHPTVDGQHGNNVLRAATSGGHVEAGKVIGMYEPRRYLNKLHSDLLSSGFDTVEGRVIENTPLILFTRVNQETFEAVNMIVHCAFWDQPKFYDSVDVSFLGQFERAEFMIKLSIDDDKKRHVNPKGTDTIFGLGRDAYSTIINTDHANLAQTFHHHGVSDGMSKIHIRVEQMPPGSVLVFRSSFGNANETAKQLAKQLESVPVIVHDAVVNHPEALVDFSYLLYSAEPEERAISQGGRGLYCFDNTDVRYAGIATPLKLLDAALRTNNYHDWASNHAIVENMTNGDWLWNYHADRLGVRRSLFGIRDIVKEALANLERSNVPRIMRPLVFYKFLREIFECIKQHVATQSEFKASNDPLVTALMMSTLMFYAQVDGSPLVAGTTQPSICAGLPHFSSGFMRAWGRDTFIALPGVLLSTGRIEEAKNEILGFARTMRHANIPNLLDSGNTSRYNARDATWFFLRALRLVCDKLSHSKCAEFLNTVVDLRWQDTLNYQPVMRPSEKDQITLIEMVHYILSSHRNGIEYREWNAGYKIDEHMTSNGFNVEHRYDTKTGLVLGGNPDNCGTWMDKMGSSAKAKNKGVPSTPRDGAPVEIAAMLGATLRWVVQDLIPKHKFPTKPFGDATESYDEWYQLVISTFENTYYNSGGNYYNDLYGSSNLARCSDGQLRCNWFIAACEIPEAFEGEPMRYLSALSNSESLLFGEKHQLGLKTLSPLDPNFKPLYLNDDDSTDASMAHGASYHQGPEWVWPLGFMVMAYQSVKTPRSDTEMSASNCHARGILTAHRRFIQQDTTMSLPEITQNDGQICIYSAWSQAWSVGMCIEAIGFLGDKSSALSKVAVKSLPPTKAVEENVKDTETTTSTDISMETVATPNCSQEVELPTRVAVKTTVADRAVTVESSASPVLLASAESSENAVPQLSEGANSVKPKPKKSNKKRGAAKTK